jgi:hypothetical protein
MSTVASTKKKPKQILRLNSILIWECHSSTHQRQTRNTYIYPYRRNKITSKIIISDINIDEPILISTNCNNFKYISWLLVSNETRFSPQRYNSEKNPILTTRENLLNLDLSILYNQPATQMNSIVSDINLSQSKTWNSHS